MSNKILVADDSYTIQRAVAIALSGENVEIFNVSKPEEVILKVQEVQPNLILLDYRMNKNGVDDGYDICKHIKANTQIPVVFLSGQAYQAELGDAAGAAWAIQKPFETDKFSEKVMELLSYSAASSDSLPIAEPAEAVAPPPPAFTPEPPTAPAPVAPTPPPPAADPFAPRINATVPRETVAMPTFTPVDSSGMLPQDDLNTETVVDRDKPGMIPPPVPKEAAPVDVADFVPPLGNVDGGDTIMEERSPLMPPPPVAPPSPPAPVTPPEPPASNWDSGEIEVADPDPVPRRSPLIIPTPSSDDPQEFPVKDLLSPAPDAAASEEANDDDLIMESPSFLPPGVATPSPDSGSALLAVEPPAPVAPPPVPVTPPAPPAPVAPPSPAPVAAEPPSPMTPPPVPVTPPAPPAPVAPPPVPVTTEPPAPVAPAPVAPAADSSLAIDPQKDYLARALAGSRRWTTAPAAPASGQDAAQMDYISKLSQEIIERIAWEVVPDLAETMIREVLSKQK